MANTIKIIRDITVSSFITFGLVACASQPAPWTQQNDSPWGAKHAAQANNVPSDEAVSNVVDEPVLLEDMASEPVNDTMAESNEPIVINEPASEPMMESVAVPVVQTTEQKVLAMPANYYAVQVYASNTTASVDKFVAEHNLQELTMVKTDRSGSTVYVLIDIYPDRNTAKNASIDLERIISAKPWVRPLSGVQKIIAQ